MVVLWHRRRELAMFYLFVLIYSAGVVVFFVNARFRLPIMPVMVIFASYGAFYAISAYRQRSLQLVKALIVLSAAAIIVNAEFMWFHKVRAYSNAISNYTLGNAYLKMGLEETALGHYQRADAINQENPTNAYGLIARDVNYNMGLLLWGSGMCTRAIEALGQVGGEDVYAVNALDRLGDCYLRRGDLDNAYNAYSRLRRIDPDDLRGPTGHARCYAAGRNYPEAEKLLEGLVDPTGETYPPAWMTLAEIQYATGRVEEAIESYKGVARFPGYAKDAYLALAEIYQQIGDYDNALDALQKVQRYVPAGDPTIQALINRLRSQR
jgi:tetratricopeptide (TPR) repeat protein